VTADTAKVSASRVSTTGIEAMASSGASSSGPTKNAERNETCSKPLAVTSASAGAMRATIASRVGANGAPMAASTAATATSCAKCSRPSASSTAATPTSTPRARSVPIISRRRS
jgi:hypothetical protein